MGYAGAILQVVNATYSTLAVSNSTTFIDTGLSATITPTSSGSKILILVAQNGLQKNSDNANNAVNLRLMRDSTLLTPFGFAVGFTGTAVFVNPSTCGTTYLDSPGSTSAITYKTMFANFFNGTGVSVQNGGNATSTITLMELAS
jgi:hypothetical protein